MNTCLVRMNFPKNCINCSTKINPEERQCNIDGHIFEETLDKLLYGRDKNCPVLMALPDVHGRLIDEDETLVQTYRSSDGRRIFDMTLTVKGVLGEYAKFVKTIVPAEPPKEAADGDQ